MKFDWRQGILYLTTIGMEGCWLYAVIDLLNRKVTGGSLFVPGLLLIYPFSFGYNVILGRIRLRVAFLQSLRWFLWIIVMLLAVKMQLYNELRWLDTSWLIAVPQAISGVINGFKPELLILISTAAIWWLSWRLSSSQGSFAALVSEFQFGLIMLIIIFLIASPLKVELMSPISVVLVFFLFALTGISVAHAMESKSWLSGLYQGHWSGLLLSSIGVIVILGLLVSTLITPDLLHIFWSAIKWVASMIWGLIMMVITFIANLLPEPGPAKMPPMPTMPGVEGSDEEIKFFWTIPESVRRGLNIGWTILISGLIIAALWRISSDIIGLLRRRLAGMAGAELEPLPGAFMADLLGFLKRILFKLLRIKLPIHIEMGSMFTGEASVRQVYRWLLNWASAAGYPRYTSQTPHEYLNLLVGLLPQAQRDLDLITQQYVRARYGILQPSKDELRQLGQSWHRVRQNNLKHASAQHTRE